MSGARSPIVGSFCCARAARDQAATAPPSNVMKSRRLNRSKCIPLSLARLTAYLIRWARRKFKRLCGRSKGARQWLARVRRANPTLFSYWRFFNVGSRTSESHTPGNCCVRFVATVASGHATLATRRALPLTWAGLTPAGSHQLCLARFAVGTRVTLARPTQIRTCGFPAYGPTSSSR